MHYTLMWLFNKGHKSLENQGTGLLQFKDYMQSLELREAYGREHYLYFIYYPHLPVNKMNYICRAYLFQKKRHEPNTGTKRCTVSKQHREAANGCF